MHQIITSPCVTDPGLICYYACIPSSQHLSPQYLFSHLGVWLAFICCSSPCLSSVTRVTDVGQWLKDSSLWDRRGTEAGRKCLSSNQYLLLPSQRSSSHAVCYVILRPDLMELKWNQFPFDGKKTNMFRWNCKNIILYGKLRIFIIIL